MHVRVHVCECVRLLVCTHEFVCMCMCMCMRVCVCVYVGACMLGVLVCVCVCGVCMFCVCPGEWSCKRDQWIFEVVIVA